MQKKSRLFYVVYDLVNDNNNEEKNYINNAGQGKGTLQLFRNLYKIMLKKYIKTQCTLSLL